MPDTDADAASQQSEGGTAHVPRSAADSPAAEIDAEGYVAEQQSQAVAPPCHVEECEIPEDESDEEGSAVEAESLDGSVDEMLYAVMICAFVFV